MLVKHLGRVDYEPTWRAMQVFTDGRTAQTPDEIWFCEHPPVYTQGLAGKSEHLLKNPNNIPVVQTDRGGQITYHGPGQLMVYCLLDLQRLKLGVRQLVSSLENSVITMLADFGVRGEARADAPGVYVNGAKIAALGLKVRRGCSYHGLSLNIDLDESPFLNINPCGYAGLSVTSLGELGVRASMEDVEARVEVALKSQFKRDPFELQSEAR